MKKYDIELSSLVEVYEGSSLDMLTNSDFISKKGKHCKSFYIASCPLIDGSQILYQVNIIYATDNGNKPNVGLFLNIQHMVVGKGRNQHNSLFFNPNSPETSVGELQFHTYSDSWDMARNSIFTAVYDYVDKCIEKKLA